MEKPRSGLSSEYKLDVSKQLFEPAGVPSVVIYQPG
jgi:hypothetical protein